MSETREDGPRRDPGELPPLDAFREEEGEVPPTESPGWFADLLDGRLDPEDTRERLAQLRRDPGLRRDFETYQAAVAELRRLGEATEGEDGGPFLRKRLLRGLGLRPPEPLPLEGRRSRAGALLALLGSGSLAAAALIGFLLLVQGDSPRHETGILGVAESPGEAKAGKPLVFRPGEDPSGEDLVARKEGRIRPGEEKEEAQDLVASLEVLKKRLGAPAKDRLPPGAQAGGSDRPHRGQGASKQEPGSGKKGADEVAGGKRLGEALAEAGDPTPPPEAESLRAKSKRGKEPEKSEGLPSGRKKKVGDDRARGDRSAFAGKERKAPLPSRLENTLERLTAVRDRAGIAAAPLVSKVALLTLDLPRSRAPEIPGIFQGLELQGFTLRPAGPASLPVPGKNRDLRKKKEVSKAAPSTPSTPEGAEGGAGRRVRGDPRAGQTRGGWAREFAGSGILRTGFFEPGRLIKIRGPRSVVRRALSRVLALSLSERILDLRADSLVPLGSLPDRRGLLPGKGRKAGKEEDGTKILRRAAGEATLKDAEPEPTERGRRSSEDKARRQEEVVEVFLKLRLGAPGPSGTPVRKKE